MVEHRRVELLIRLRVFTGEAPTLNPYKQCNYNFNDLNNLLAGM